VIPYTISLNRYLDRSGYRVCATHGSDNYLDVSYKSLKFIFLFLCPGDLHAEWKRLNLWKRIIVAVKIAMRDIQKSKKE